MDELRQNFCSISVLLSSVSGFKQFLHAYEANALDINICVYRISCVFITPTNRIGGIILVLVK